MQNEESASFSVGIRAEHFEVSAIPGELRGGLGEPGVLDVALAIDEKEIFPRFALVGTRFDFRHVDAEPAEGAASLAYTHHVPSRLGIESTPALEAAAAAGAEAWLRGRGGLRAKILVISVAVTLLSLAAVLAVSSHVFAEAYLSALQSRSVAIAQGLRLQMDRILQLGIQIENLSGFDKQCKMVTDAYPGALFEGEGGHLHPLNYTLGLARAAREAGAVLHEGSPAVEIRRGHPAVVVTPGGRVTADFVVMGTNAFQSGLVPEFSGRIMRAANYIIATEPLSAERAAQVLPQNDALSDANFVLDYYRLSADRRLIYGGEVSYTGREPRGLQARMDAKIASLFPALRGVRIDYRWGGEVAITLNRAPDFGRVGDNLYYAQGYSGHGMALAGLAGKLMAESVAGQSERFDVFAAMPHRRFPGGERLRTPLLLLATTFYKLRDRL